uniref:Uncharacterized protein n=1 Tax=Arion vulgaris TaxID=1028688 RepID=A0A0B7AVU6_9EUPU
MKCCIIASLQGKNKFRLYTGHSRQLHTPEQTDYTRSTQDTTYCLYTRQKSKQATTVIKYKQKIQDLFALELITNVSIVCFVFRPVFAICLFCDLCIAMINSA